MNLHNVFGKALYGLERKRSLKEFFHSSYNDRVLGGYSSVSVMGKYEGFLGFDISNLGIFLDN